MKKSLLIILALFIGCASFVPVHTFTKTGFGEKRQPFPEDCEIVVLSSSPKDLDYEEIGMCVAQTPGGGMLYDATPKLIAELKECACVNGGNAIVFSMNQVKESNMMGLEISQQKVKGSAIVLFVKTK
jgi:hypothetical protein